MDKYSSIHSTFGAVPLSARFLLLLWPSVACLLQRWGFKDHSFPFLSFPWLWWLFTFLSFPQLWWLFTFLPQFVYPSLNEMQNVFPPRMQRGSHLFSSQPTWLYSCLLVDDTNEFDAEIWWPCGDGCQLPAVNISPPMDTVRLSYGKIISTTISHFKG